MTFTLTFALKIAFLDFAVAGGIVSVPQTQLDFSNNFCHVQFLVRRNINVWRTIIVIPRASSTLVASLSLDINFNLRGAEDWAGTFSEWRKCRYPLRRQPTTNHSKAARWRLSFKHVSCSDSSNGIKETNKINNFLTISDKDFIIIMHTKLIMNLYTKDSHFGLCCRQNAFMFHKYIMYLVQNVCKLLHTHLIL